MRILSFILMLALIGCRQRGVESQQPGLSRAQVLAMMSSRSANKARRPVLALGPRLQLDVYHLTVPFGTISRNESFWKNVDEQRVDLATYDLLFKNGVRVGVAAVAEWEHFRQIMEDHPANYVGTSYHGSEAADIELAVRNPVETQNIFYLDRLNQLQGRTYDRCENFITLAFQQAPRKQGHVRVVLCPVVRGTRQRLEYTRTGTELEISYNKPERLYDLNLRADLTAEEFMIVAPSSESTWPTSIGNCFFIHDGPAERVETVLLIVPKVIK